MRFKFSVFSYFLIPADEVKELPVNLKVVVTNSDFGLLIFFSLLLLLTVTLAKPRFGCTDAYFGK